MADDFKFLKRYTRPDHFVDFADFDRTEYYVAIGRHRDSDTLTESNFRSLLKRLGGESDTVLVVRDSHSLVGWVEAIYIHESDRDRCKIADEILEHLDGYPVVDESDWSQLQLETAEAYWSRCNLRERIRWCADYRVSIFAARRDYIPDDPSGELIYALAD